MTRPPYSVLDKTKIKETFNIEIPHWKDSLAFCLRQMEEIITSVISIVMEDIAVQSELSFQMTA